VTIMTIRLDPEEEEPAALARLVRSFAGARVLEIGCGDGRLTRRYAAQAASVVAIDPDESAVVTFRADPPGGAVDVQTLGFSELMLPERSVDIVLFSWSL
jgi:2-polyprenyl-3-methyl-5-hydroxy-6-metoxy-1,4-benzoquinol methylase